MRPKLILLTEYSSRNDKAQDELDFGICNVDMKRTITIFLSNVTEVTANWMLNYVKFPKKQTISKYTTTAWEEENLEKLDDPEVFEFSLDQVRHSFIKSLLSSRHSTVTVKCLLSSNFKFCLTLLTKCYIASALTFTKIGIAQGQIRASKEGTGGSYPPTCAQG